MVQRKIFPAPAGYNILVSSEKMADGQWASVATLTQSTNGGQRAIDLPVSLERFETAADAERMAVDRATAWIEQNAAPDEPPIPAGPPASPGKDA